MKALQQVYGKFAQFIPLLLTFLLAAASYWYAHYNTLSLFQSKRKPNPEVRDYYLKNFTVQVHDLAQNRFAVMQSQFAEQRCHLTRRVQGQGCGLHARQKLMQHLGMPSDAMVGDFFGLVRQAKPRQIQSNHRL